MIGGGWEIKWVLERNSNTPSQRNKRGEEAR